MKGIQTSLVSTSLDRLALSRHPFSHTCGRKTIEIQCLKCGHKRPILAGSRDRTCPACAREMGSRLYLRYEKLLKGMDNLKFVTFTWRPVKKQDSGVIRKMGLALSRFLHLKLYRRAWKGLLATVECKKTPSGWFYYHIHCIVQGSFVPQAQISMDWRKESGFPIVFIEKIWRTPTRCLRYVLKYVLKGFTFEDLKDKADFKGSMKGVRYIRSYGNFYNFEYHMGKHVYFPCPECGAVRSWVVLDFLSDEWIRGLAEGWAYGEDSSSEILAS